MKESAMLSEASYIQLAGTHGYGDVHLHMAKFLKLAVPTMSGHTDKAENWKSLQFFERGWQGSEFHGKEIDIEAFSMVVQMSSVL